MPGRVFAREETHRDSKLKVILRSIFNLNVLKHFNRAMGFPKHENIGHPPQSFRCKTSGIVNRFAYCTSFVWGRVNFLHSAWYEAMFGNCAEHRVYNTEIFLLLLSRACTGPRPFLLCILPQWQGRDGSAREAGRKQSGQVTSSDQRNIHVAS